MTKEDVTARLRELATDDKKRTETARLRDVFDDVEATLKAGVSQADVLATLKASGFTMTMASFKSALQRIRKERRSDAPPAAKAAPAQPQSSATAAAPAPAEAPKTETEAIKHDEPNGHTSMKNRGEAVASKYMGSATNPLLKKLNKD